MTADDDFTAELPLLLTGELDRSRLREVVAHLRDCPGCRADLVEAAAAHAALTATRRTLAEPVRREPALSLVEPADEAPLPALPVRAHRHPTRRRVLAAGVAAAVVLGLGLGGVAVTGHWPGGAGGGSSARPPSAARAADFEPVPSGNGQVAVPGASGVVRMTGPAGRTDMTIRTSGLPQAASGHFYYAWLLDPKTNKMLPLGVVAADSASTFEVANALVDRYSAIDISLQADDGNPVHSPVSVLRATYAA
jgi:anti-sigma factor RsiW